MPLEKGTLWANIVETTERALKSGALLPVPTDYTFIEDGGIRFFVRVLAGLKLKDEAKKNEKVAAKAGRTINPFLPPEKELLVADITDTHLAVLNKFNVVEHHLLLVTRSFEDQEMLLTLKDLEALWLCMAEYDSLAFYNGGREAGASQQHKHLQLVPLPWPLSAPQFRSNRCSPMRRRKASCLSRAFPSCMLLRAWTAISHVHRARRRRERSSFIKPC